MTETVWQIMRDLSRVRKGGPTAVAERQRTRLAELLAHTRANSPYYRKHYANVPDQVHDLTTLPVTTKPELMDHFDDWATDRTITLDAVQRFIEDDTKVDQLFLDRHMVVTTAGTTGYRGIFVLDDRMYNVLTALSSRTAKDWLTWREVPSLIRHGGRAALLIASYGHYAGYAMVKRLYRERPSRKGRIRAFSVQMPLTELAAQVNDFRPAILNGYASAILLLAREQAEGRLGVQPTLVVTSSESLSDKNRTEIAEAWNTKVHDSYSCAEFMGLAYGCAYDWLHVHADWVILEPVDADYRPTPPGELSQTVLLTNLANRIQPLVRYDLGDSVTQRPAPCPCGNPLPAIRVQGRTSEVLVFTTKEGHQIRIPPLTFGTLVDRIPGVKRYQVIHVAPERLLVRLETAANADPDSVLKEIHTVITGMLAEHGLSHVAVVRDSEPPRPSPSGKFHTVYSAL